MLGKKSLVVGKQGNDAANVWCGEDDSGPTARFTRAHSRTDPQLQHVLHHPYQQLCVCVCACVRACVCSDSGDWPASSVPLLAPGSPQHQGH